MNSVRPFRFTLPSYFTLLCFLFSVNGMGQDTFVFKLQGTISDVSDSQPIEGATIKITRSDGDWFFVTTDVQGRWFFDETIMLVNMDFVIRVSADGFLTATGTETTNGLVESTLFLHDFELQHMQECTMQWFPYLEFEPNSTVVNTDSLLFYFQTLKENPNIMVEFSGQTDSREKRRLGIERARVVANELIEMGIHHSRIVIAASKSENRVASDEYINSLPSSTEKELAHAKNRRVSLVVLRDDFTGNDK